MTMPPNSLFFVREGFCPLHELPLSPCDTPDGPGGRCINGETWCVHKGVIAETLVTMRREGGGVSMVPPIPTA